MMYLYINMNVVCSACGKCTAVMLCTRISMNYQSKNKTECKKPDFYIRTLIDFICSQVGVNILLILQE